MIKDNNFQLKLDPKYRFQQLPTLKIENKPEIACNPFKLEHDHHKKDIWIGLPQRIS